MKLSDVAQKTLGCRLEGPARNSRFAGGVGRRRSEHAESGDYVLAIVPVGYFPLLKTTRASRGSGRRRIGWIGKPLPALCRASLGYNHIWHLIQAIELFYQYAARYAPGDASDGDNREKCKDGEGAHVGPYCYVERRVESGPQCRVPAQLVRLYRGERSLAKISIRRAGRRCVEFLPPRRPGSY